MKKSQILLLAVGSGVSVSTLYLSQPILNVIAKQQHLSLHTAASLITYTQIGYMLGLLFLSPLGDIFPKKVLISIKLCALFCCLLIASFTQTPSIFFAVSLLIGILATTAQDYVLLAADLANNEERGRVLGTVVSGLLLGVLASRTFSGVICEYWGVGAVYASSSVLVLIFMALVIFLIPTKTKNDEAEMPAHNKKYFPLLRSMLGYLSHSRLTLSLLTHGFLVLTFSAFWTMISFYLASSPFLLSSDKIGYFALAGLAGAACAPIVGRFSGAGGSLLNIRVAICIFVVAFLLMLGWMDNLMVLIVGAVLFDLGVQVSLVSHQSIILAIDPSARARLNSLFIAGGFLFFAMGSFLGSVCFAQEGFRGVIILALLCAFCAFCSNMLLRKVMKSSTAFSQKRVACER